MADSALVCCALAGQNGEGRGLGIVASDNMELAEQCSGCYRAMSRHGVAARPREGPGMQLRALPRGAGRPRSRACSQFAVMSNNAASAAPPGPDLGAGKFGKSQQILSISEHGSS